MSCVNSSHFAISAVTDRLKYYSMMSEKIKLLLSTQYWNGACKLHLITSAALQRTDTTTMTLTQTLMIYQSECNDVNYRTTCLQK